tara:strand:+ start:369 stop:959 length:591 start_codon:yes stop_codon:yes gene_type:complete
MIEYRYNQGDLLNNPQKYTFTEFANLDFLDAYKKSRNIHSTHSDISLDLFQNLFKFLIPNINTNLILNNEIETEKSLKIILIEIFQKNFLNYKHIDIFVKKFELTKKLFEKYDKKFISKSKNYSDLINYILLSFICLLCYKQEKNLKYLNTALKLNDTLTNQISKNHKYFIPLEYLVKIELNFIDKLIEEKVSNYD